MQARTISALVNEVRQVQGATTCLEVDRLFQEELALTSIVVEDGGHRAVIDRSWFAPWLAGRLGFGRALHAARPVRDLAQRPSLELPHDTPVYVAADRLLAREGRERYVDAIVTHLGEVVGTVSVAAVLEELARTFEHRAHHDALTGLPNRARLVDRLELALSGWVGAGQDATAVGLLFIDLDGFKAVNDGLGHQAGDELLVAVGARLLGALRTVDTVARLGGDEFAVLVEAPDDARIADLADRLVRELRVPFELSAGPVSVHASVGIAIAVPGDAAGELLRRADMAMYRAKQDGGDRWVAADLGAEHGWCLDDAARLRQAIDRGELTLHYQPIVDLDGGGLRRVEALVRWPQPDGILRPPLAFIALAERCGAINELGQWVVRRALEQLAAWDRELGSAAPPAVNVNLSVLQLEDTQLSARIADALDRSGVAADRLCLEVTETALVRDLAGSVQVLGELRALGVQIAIDDFGVGSSSLGHLARLPFTALKMDRSFTSQLDDEGARRVAESVVALGRALGLEVVAEGIEKREQEAFFRELGCELGQGFHYARPMPADELAALVAAGVPGERVGSVLAIA
ncbi:MAG: putative bifunctional diguanylate cyclase/phosphodiesterase [Nitriliruptoraceae bacterium]